MFYIWKNSFDLSKEEFCDAIALQYNRSISNLPSKYPYGNNFDVNHAMNSKKGGSISMRHNSIRNFKANLIKKVCTDVEIKSKLQPVNNNDARLDVRTRGFWRLGQSAFFDIRAANTNAITPIEKVLSKSLKHICEGIRFNNAVA